MGDLRQAGKGAWLNGKPIRPSTIDQMIDAMLITGFRFQFFNTPRSNLPYFNRVMLEAQCVRRLGSAALDLAYVANGRVEGFWEIALNPWDVAAGILIIREAGGIVSTLHGEGHLLKGSVDILAANPIIFPKLQTILDEGMGLTASVDQAAESAEQELSFRKTGLAISLAAILLVVVALQLKIRSLHPPA